MIAWICAFLTSQSSGLSCPFDPLGSVGPVVGLFRPVNTLYSPGPYTGLVSLTFKSYVLLPRLGLLGTYSHSSVSNGVAIVGELAKVLNCSGSGCSGITSGTRAVTA